MVLAGTTIVNKLMKVDNPAYGKVIFWNETFFIESLTTCSAFFFLYPISIKLNLQSYLHVKRDIFIELITVFAGMYDLATSIQLLVLLLWTSGKFWELYLIFTIFPFVLSQTYLVSWYKRESRNDTALGHFLVSNQKFVLPVIFLARYLSRMSASRSKSIFWADTRAF